MSTLSEQFRDRIEAFLRGSGCKATELGRQAIGDPSFVLNLRRGRSPTLSTADKIIAFIAASEASAVAAPRNRRKS